MNSVDHFVYYFPRHKRYHNKLFEIVAYSSVAHIAFIQYLNLTIINYRPEMTVNTIVTQAKNYTECKKEMRYDAH